MVDKLEPGWGLWEATDLLWSPSQKRYIQPGETIALPDELAKKLLNKRVIRPAVFKRNSKKQGV